MRKSLSTSVSVGMDVVMGEKSWLSAASCEILVLSLSARTTILVVDPRPVRCSESRDLGFGDRLELCRAAPRRAELWVAPAAGRDSSVSVLFQNFFGKFGDFGNRRLGLFEIQRSGTDNNFEPGSVTRVGMVGACNTGDTTGSELVEAAEMLLGTLGRFLVSMMQRSISAWA